MSICKRIGRAIAAAMLVATALTGVASTAMADTTTSVTTIGITNVCTADWGFASSSSPNVDITWDGTSLMWPTGTNSLGNFSWKLKATGEPDNRGCKWSFSNTPFTNGSIQLLPATALQQTGTSNSQFGANFTVTAGIQIPLGNPGGGIDDPLNTKSYSYPVEIDSVNITPGLNQQAPAGVYTSTITMTITALAPI
jgi:hypothetical protein